MTQRLSGRRVALYVSGSVAAPKACAVVTGLRGEAAEVRVAMTQAAGHFVSAMTFRALSGNPVTTSLWEEEAAAAVPAGHGMEHIALGAWAELQLAVPASADLITRLALGLADDAVTATALASRAPLVIVPAMETAMWEHPATRRSVETLRDRGASFVGPGSGRLASGDSGEGRMVEPPEVVDAAVAALAVTGG